MSLWIWLLEDLIKFFQLKKNSMKILYIGKTEFEEMLLREFLTHKFF